MRSFLLYLTWAALLILASAGYAAVVSQSASPNAAAGSLQPSVRLPTNGNTGGLYPGGSGLISLQVRNHSSRPVTLRVIRTRVGNASPACTSNNLSATTRRHLAQRLRPHRKRTVLITVAMPHSAGDGCQGATFPLKFQAKVTP